MGLHLGSTSRKMEHTWISGPWKSLSTASLPGVTVRPSAATSVSFSTVVLIHTTGTVEKAFKPHCNDLFSFIQFCFINSIGAKQNHPLNALFKNLFIVTVGCPLQSWPLSISHGQAWQNTLRNSSSSSPLPTPPVVVRYLEIWLEEQME